MVLEFSYNYFVLVPDLTKTLTKTTEFRTEIRSSKQSVSGVKAIAIL